jgi:hypothetical protein
MIKRMTAEEVAIKIAAIGQMRCGSPDCMACALHKAEGRFVVREDRRATLEAAAKRTVQYFMKKFGHIEDEDELRAEVLRDEED